MKRRIPFLLVLGAVLFAGYFVRLPLFAEGPGPVRDVLPAISFSGHERYATTGRLVLTTVAVTRDRLTPFQFVHAWLDPDQDLVPEDEILPPGETEEQERERAISSMDTSKIAAAYVVLSELTSYPRRHGRGALVEQVAGGCPAEGDLFPGDVILEIDGEPVRDLDDASQGLAAVPAGRELMLEIRAGGQVEEVRLAKQPCAGSEKPIIGAAMVPNFPIGISFRSGDVTGPSAGLMWALGLYELLSPDDLSRGRVIAGTGEIDPSGEVTPIAGVEKKILAAERAGADVFLIPDDNLAEVNAEAGDLELIPVGSFEDAIEKLNG
ncbi:MAG: S16 family serine protease [Actinomycetota bacterium]